MPSLNIKDVLKKHTPDLMEIPGVSGVAIGESNGNMCIRVFVANSNSECLKQIPNKLEGYPVLVDESGAFRALHG
jgi:hypothetical protein